AAIVREAHRSALAVRQREIRSDARHECRAQDRELSEAPGLTLLVREITLPQLPRKARQAEPLATFTAPHERVGSGALHRNADFATAGALRLEREPRRALEVSNGNPELASFDDSVQPNRSVLEEDRRARYSHKRQSKQHGPSLYAAPPASTTVLSSRPCRSVSLFSRSFYRAPRRCRYRCAPSASRTGWPGRRVPICCSTPSTRWTGTHGATKRSLERAARA